jgi:cystathionine beta-lyase/cystathionine gamma-synthase
MPSYRRRTTSPAGALPECICRGFREPAHGPAAHDVRRDSVNASISSVSATACKSDSHALATSSGMEAVSTVYLGLLSVGDRVVCGDSAYGPWRVACVALGR